MNIIQGKTTMPNPTCIKCSQVFYKNMEIKNENPTFEKVYGITGQEMTDKIFLKKILVSLANEGSGVLICGVSANNRTRIQGFKPDATIKSKFESNVLEIYPNIFPRVYVSPVE